MQNRVKERYITFFNSIFNSCGLVGLLKFVFLGLSQYLVLYKPVSNLHALQERLMNREATSIMQGIMQRT